MRVELQDKLNDAFPFLENVYFECGDGWFDLVWRVAVAIDNLYFENGLETDVEVGQIKEKFGGLRLYVYDRSLARPSVVDAMYNIVGMAERESFKICELCGTEGNLTQYNNIWGVRCDKCNS
jgi:hypothetical protein